MRAAADDFRQQVRGCLHWRTYFRRNATCRASRGFQQVLAAATDGAGARLKAMGLPRHRSDERRRRHLALAPMSADAFRQLHTIALQKCVGRWRAASASAFQRSTCRRVPWSAAP